MDAKKAREHLKCWQEAISQNVLTKDHCFQHTIEYYFSDQMEIADEFAQFGVQISTTLESLVCQNHDSTQLPRLKQYDRFGVLSNAVEHAPFYSQIGDVLYSTHIMERFATRGELLHGMALLYLSSQLGEAGHNCPIACSAGMLRVFDRVGDFENKDLYREKLLETSFENNYTAAQFITEIQGGSDVGSDTTYAEQDENEQWHITGEKWFCSNANADLFFVAARFDKNIAGTKGLGLFLVPAKLEADKPNDFEILRLKDKLGTRTLATGEIKFQGALAYPMGALSNGFQLMMEQVLHCSRLLNAISVVGMARRAYEIAWEYANHREAFGEKIIKNALVQEHLATVKAENIALMAATFGVAALQNKLDCQTSVSEEEKLLIRTLVNGMKYITGLWSVQHIHHCIDILAGNGVIETFSPLPRLLRDSLICENWEGTHNMMRLQFLRDIKKFEVNNIVINYLESEIKMVGDHFEEVNFLLRKVEDLRKIFNDLKNHPESLQALMVKDAFDSIMILFSGVYLLKEAVHQEKEHASSFKMDCWRYFNALHLNEEVKKDKALVLEMIEKITGAI